VTPKPHYIIPTPKRLGMGEIVTIAAGILCKDGVVLCADTEHTISEDRKSQGSKLTLGGWHYPFEDYREHRDRDVSLTIGFGGAGHLPWITGFIQGMNKEVLEEVPDEFDQKVLEESFEKYSRAYFEKYIKAYADNPNHRPQVDMLVLATFSRSRSTTHAIYNIHDNLFLKTDEESFMAVGVGAPVFQSLANVLFGSRQGMWWNRRQAASIAVYIMAKVKSEVPGCGGNTQIIMVGKYSWDHVPTDKVRELESHHLNAEGKMYSGMTKQLIKALP